MVFQIFLFPKKGIFSNIKFFICFIIFFFAQSCENNLDIDNYVYETETPQNLRIAYSSDGEILIRWNVNLRANIFKFKVYRKENNDSVFKLIDETFENYYYDSGLDYDTEYFYCVSSLNKKNIESPKSKIVSSKPLNRYPPLAPYNFTVEGRNWNEEKYFFLSWENFYDTDIKEYKIYCSDRKILIKDSSLLVANTSHNFFRYFNESLELNKEYFFAIEAIDKGDLASPLSRNSSDFILSKPMVLFPPNGYETRILNKIELSGYNLPVQVEAIFYATPFGGELFKISSLVESAINNITISIPAGVFYNKGIYYFKIYIYTKSKSPNVFSDTYYIKILD